MGSEHDSASLVSQLENGGDSCTLRSTAGDWGEREVRRRERGEEEEEQDQEQQRENGSGSKRRRRRSRRRSGRSRRSCAHLQAWGLGPGLDAQAQGHSSTQSLLQVLLHLRQLQLQIDALLLLLFTLLFCFLQALLQRSGATLSWATERAGHMMGACPVLLEAGPDSPVEASRAPFSSLLFFFSWLRWVRISCFLLISSSSWAFSLRASASTRFFPYLHWSASAAGGG